MAKLAFHRFLGALWTSILVPFWGTRAPLYSFRGVPGALLGPSTSSLGLPWSRPALSGRLLGRALQLRLGPHVAKRNRPKCGKQLSWAPPGRHYTPLGGSFSPRRPPLGPCRVLPRVLVAPHSDLLELPRGNFCVFSTCSLSVLFLCSTVGGAMCDPYMQAHVF